MTRDIPLPSSDGMFGGPGDPKKKNKYAAESYSKSAKAYRKQFVESSRSFEAGKAKIEVAKKSNSTSDYKKSDLPSLQAKATKDSTMASNSFKQMKRFEKLATQSIPKGSYMENGKVKQPTKRKKI